MPTAKPETVSLADGAGRSGGFAEHCSAPAKPVGYAEPTVGGGDGDSVRLGSQFEAASESTTHGSKAKVA